MPEQTVRASSPRRWLLVPALAGALAALAGCGHSQTCDFSDRPRDDVWAAVVQASRQPRYPDWIVIENKVKVDESQHRVTVWRDIRRDIVGQGLAPRREEKQWRFSAVVSDEAPSTVTFSTPDWSVPGHFWQEADHFFAQVRMRLGEMGPVTPAPGDPLGGAPASATRDPEAPGDAPAAPKGGALAAP
jgi:hypothetical protein